LSDFPSLVFQAISPLALPPCITTAAADAAHHVPIIGPDMGIELIKVVKRLEIVHGVYPLPPTVEVYRLALHLVLQVAAEHQRAFCAKLEEALGESD
jgi:hypothetical protein